VPEPARGIAGGGGGNKLPMYVLAVLAGAAATWAALEAEVSVARNLLCQQLLLQPPSWLMRTA